MFKDLFLSISLLCGYAILLISLHHLGLSQEINLLISTTLIAWIHLNVIKPKVYILAVSSFVVLVMMSVGLLHELMWFFIGLLISFGANFLSKQHDLQHLAWNFLSRPRRFKI